ncbi:cytochrome c oxidase subunit 6b-1 [Ricinus communis]|uniref:Cytochrome C oxidase polypeptide vib, putative n=1 Tax=Ricinus communis TaxID=3988 RepID=B9RJN9_RICCO|nr:cytochrome c oxidase subunit 6b-1 [Ricinus communis]EEF48541.1 cytochrome C oxidase polypeptide vib, putative [Ricinus communis]|eukprot:XP_002513958.1 cytochrome c oxidase subunit 6b-1 [Ricinus communis]
MADTTAGTPSLSEQYLLKDKEEKPDVGPKPVEVKEDVKPETIVSVDAAVVKAEEEPAAAAEEKAEDTAGGGATEESTITNPAAESSSEDTPAVDTESSETTEEQNSTEQEAAEETPKIKLETAPADFRFPTTNQTRHCFTRYVEYHRCTAAKGEGAPECDKFAKFYRSLCPGEWIDRWNEQRENGTFPGPL